MWKVVLKLWDSCGFPEKTTLFRERLNRVFNIIHSFISGKLFMVLKIL